MCSVVFCHIHLPHSFSLVLDSTSYVLELNLRRIYIPIMFLTRDTLNRHCLLVKLQALPSEHPRGDSSHPLPEKVSQGYSYLYLAGFLRLKIFVHHREGYIPPGIIILSNSHLS